MSLKCGITDNSIPENIDARRQSGGDRKGLVYTEDERNFSTISLRSVLL